MRTQEHHSGNRVRIILMTLLLCSALSPAVHATCTFSTPGQVFLGSFWAYSHVKNGFLQNNGECWDGSAPILNTSCGLSAVTVINFNGYSTNREKYQDIVVPAGNTDTHWQLIYELTANDPHQDGWWTSLKAKVQNITDGGTIASQTWWGDDGNLSCSQRTLYFTGNYAGKTLRVYFEGRNPTPTDTIIRVDGITLYQYY